MSEEEIRFILQIRIAGNTAAPCFSVIKQKGYDIETYVYKDSDDSYSYTWNAVKDKRRFSATSPEELLGLISMWELRGDRWNVNNDEYGEYRTITAEARVYDDDGNLLED